MLQDLYIFCSTESCSTVFMLHYWHHSNINLGIICQSGIRSEIVIYCMYELAVYRFMLIQLLQRTRKVMLLVLSFWCVWL